MVAEVHFIAMPDKVTLSTQGVLLATVVERLVSGLLETET